MKHSNLHLGLVLPSGGWQSLNDTSLDKKCLFFMIFFRYGASCGLYYKYFTIIIYNHNDSGQYYKSTIVGTASLS